MKTNDSSDEKVDKKKSKLLPILSLFLGLISGGAGFFLSYSEIILAEKNSGADINVEEQPHPIDDVVYIPIDPLVISLHKPSKSKHLRFRAQLEVPAKFRDDVEKMMPRVTDVLNTYLRAVRVTDFDDPEILIRLRTQMLHRVEIILGEERVNKFLVMEFVLT
ncbi:flagellar basal body-associated protein FliL [Sulfitobacter sp.]|uniref:flagellar basal body-associated FliL family protein n=1 Tax=Sulfitobacter sp. TaxID=1903071 RepID=UPI003564E2BE